MVGLRVKINLPALLCSVFLVSSPVIAKECVDCHSDILKQFKGNSHHIQGTAVSGRHCYACHWEATAEGQINTQYHKTPPTRKIAKGRNGVVDLVVWQNGERPTEHTKNVTAVTFSSASVGGASERLEVSKISSHCLSCHNDFNSDTRPFPGDNNPPIKYAWDGQSVASRYSEKAVTIWGKYSTAATNKKSKIIKAFSAHGNSATNQGGWNAADGYDGATTITRGGATAKNVECFDCHNSHGSKISGVTTSYRSFNGTFNGGLLKETVPGQSGYRAAYKPSANADVRSKNPYNAGAGLCFDCHETSKKGTTPWNFKTTFGAEQPIIGYKDTLRFNNGAKGSTSRFANRQGRSDIVSSHLKAGSFLNYSAHGRINGLCTPCHDPHGISRTLGDKMPYAVPLLKGTWLTSPYREDGPPAAVQNKPGGGESRAADYNAVNRAAGANFGKGDSSAPRKADFNSTNRDGNANFGRGDSSAPRSGDYNAVNRDAGANFGKGDGAPRSDFNSTNRDGNANFGRGDSSAPRSGDYNAVNRDAGANFGKGDSGAPRSDFNSTNRDGNANFGRGDSSAPRSGDYNAVNRDAGANFGKGDSGAPRSDFNSTNRDGNANFGRGYSSAPRSGDYNAVNRDAGANFGKGDSGAPRSDFNSTNRDGNANFGRGDSSAPRSGDYNAVNRVAGANFGKGDSGAPRKADFNSTNRDGNANYGKGDSSSPRKSDFNSTNREDNSNFGKMAGGTPREPMQGMQYSVDRNTFGGDKRITENDETFAGLCLKCHAKEKFAGNSKTALIHRAVKGWGDNREHSFPCSKCHQAHNSGLPRLMQTNCFQEGPSGLRENSGLSWLPYKNRENPDGAQAAEKAGDSAKNKVVGCHVRQFGKTGTAKAAKQAGQWKELTPW